MRLVDDAGQQLLRCLVSGCVHLEILLGAHDDLLGSHRSAAMPAHAVGKDSQHDARALGVGEQSDAILLLGTVPDVRGNAGFSRECH